MLSESSLEKQLVECIQMKERDKRDKSAGQAGSLETLEGVIVIA